MKYRSAGSLNNFESRFVKNQKHASIQCNTLYCQLSKRKIFLVDMSFLRDVRVLQLPEQTLTKIYDVILCH